jgi:RNA polymerase sigma factor (sigma-70 family)
MVIFLINKFNSRDKNKAQEELLLLYEGLIVSIVKKYLGRGIDFDDLIQAGKLGLLHAAEKFDPSKSKFSTYSTNWVRQYCLRTIENNARNVRLPNHVHEALSKILKYGIDLSVEELEVLTGLDKNKIISAVSGYHTLTLCQDDIKELTYIQDYNMLTFTETLERVFDKLEINEDMRKAYMNHYDLGVETSKLAIELQIHEHLLVNKFAIITKEFSNFMDENAAEVFEGEENGENKDRSTGEI